MKGIAHFAAGVAAASCFPQAVAAGAAGNPLYFVLGGVFGLLPDTLDFKLWRFLYRHDAEVVPDPLAPDPRTIADAVAGAVGRAAETGRPFRLKLATIRLGADAWQRYELVFDVPGRRVGVRYGPVVDTGGNPLRAAGRRLEAWAPLCREVELDYEARTVVDIFDGPLFRMTPAPGGKVRPQFIPWHRQWSHSLTAGALFALAAWVAWNGTAAAIVAAAHAAHVALDQLGFMGSNLLFPLTRSRTPGLRLAHSGKAAVNFAAVWLSGAVVLLNLWRAAPGPGAELNPIRFAVYAAAPLLAALMLARRGRPANGGKKS